MLVVAQACGDTLTDIQVSSGPTLSLFSSRRSFGEALLVFNYKL